VVLEHLRSAFIGRDRDVLATTEFSSWGDFEAEIDKQAIPRSEN
jgi:hypothetical protein